MYVRNVSMYLTLTSNDTQCPLNAKSNLDRPHKCSLPSAVRATQESTFVEIACSSFNKLFSTEQVSVNTQITVIEAPISYKSMKDVPTIGARKFRANAQNCFRINEDQTWDLWLETYLNYSGTWLPPPSPGSSGPEYVLSCPKSQARSWEGLRRLSQGARALPVESWLCYREQWLPTSSTTGRGPLPSNIGHCTGSTNSQK